MLTESAPSVAQAGAVLVWRPDQSRALAERALREVGFDSVTAVDGAVQGFAVLAQQPARIILVDVGLRPTSGLVFLRELRATAAPGQETPAVLVSARPSDTLAADARRAGADGVIFGPVTAEALRFWVSYTEPDVRTIVSGEHYRGPDRRSLPPTATPFIPERRSAAVSPASLAAIAEDPIVSRTADACMNVSGWGQSGDPVQLDQAIAALIEAGALARDRADVSLVRGIEAALQRLRIESQSWDVDTAGIAGALEALKDLAARRFERSGALPFGTLRHAGMGAAL
jgi:two-component system chemotaxis response regulator CheY